MIRSRGLSSLVALAALVAVSDQGRAEFVTAQSWGWYQKTSTTASRNDVSDPAQKDYLTGKTGSAERRAYFEFQLTSGAAEAQLWLYLPNPNGYASSSASEAITLYRLSTDALNPGPNSFEAGQVFSNFKNVTLSNPLNPVTLSEADEGTWISIPLSSAVTTGQLIIGVAMENVSTGDATQYVFGGTSPDNFPPGSITALLGLGPNSSPPLPVPEPGSLTLVGVAALSALHIVRRKWKRPAA